MPKAFADGGFVIGLIFTPIIGLIMNSCIHMLLNTNQYLCDKLKLPLMDYEEVFET
jgi:amino acid permease